MLVNGILVVKDGNLQVDLTQDGQSEPRIVNRIQGSRVFWRSADFVSPGSCAQEREFKPTLNGGMRTKPGKVRMFQATSPTVNEVGSCP